MEENEDIVIEDTNEVAVKRPHWTSALNENQLKGAELMALGKYTQKKIAEIVGVEEQTISRRWKHNPIFMQYLDYLTTQNTLDSALRVKGLTLEAIEVYSQLLKNPNPNVKFRVAKDILDRAGVKDLKFDLLPKDGDDKEKKDYETLKKRLLAIVESEQADEGVSEDELEKLNKWNVKEADIIELVPESDSYLVEDESDEYNEEYEDSEEGYDD